jgi:8-oxo-dGTP pyrophosphatase MutT (NUDIX family)
VDIAWANLRERLVGALRDPLPGAPAQARMAPVPRPGWHPQAPPPPGRPAAVLALFYPLGCSLGDERRAPRPALLFTERTESVETHRGQVSFPGGGIEPGESPEEAALREAGEEAAVAVEEIEVLGRLTPLWIPATGYLVTPVVGLTARRPAFRPSPREVQRILEVPVADLMRPDAVRGEELPQDGRWIYVRYFDIAGTRLWGATAMMTAELLTLLGW